MPLLLDYWKPIVGLEGVYEISVTAKVRRVGKACGATQGAFLKPTLRPDGYYSIVLRNRGNDRRALLQGLVAAAFLGPRPEGQEVNHIDRNPSNNRLSNLEYLTPKNNQIHAARTGSKHYKLTPERVEQLRVRFREVGVIARVAEEFGIDSSYCGKVLRGDYWPTAA